MVLSASDGASCTLLYSLYGSLAELWPEPSVWLLAMPPPYVDGEVEAATARDPAWYVELWVNRGLAASMRSWVGTGRRLALTGVRASWVLEEGLTHLRASSWDPQAGSGARADSSDPVCLPLPCLLWESLLPPELFTPSVCAV